MAWLYPAFARLFSISFVLVGIGLAFLPDQLAGFMTWLMNSLGLPGTVTFETDGLGFVLSISLMGAITVLADTIARRPERTDAYVGLMAAKLISTAGFGYLALTVSPVWYLPVGTDAFVALALFTTRRWWLASQQGEPAALPAGFARVKTRHNPHYEVWFGKVDIAPGQALWFRYTMLLGKQREAAAWAILFDGDDIVTGKKSWPVEELATPNRVILPEGSDPARHEAMPQVFHVGDAHLDTRNALGSAGEVSWDLRWTDSGRRFGYVPQLLRKLGVAKSSYEAAFMDIRFDGTVRCGDRTIEVRDATGMIGHIDGRRHADTWAWVHCNHFDGQPDIVFEGISARVPLGGKPSKPFSAFVLYVGAHRYEFATPLKMLKAETTFGDGKWEFATESDGVRLSGKARAPEQVALVEYVDTDGSNLWCYNSKLADVELRIEDPKLGLDRTFRANGTASFELVERTPPTAEVMLR